MTRFRKALLPLLLLGCGGGMAHSQQGMPPEPAVRRFAGIIEAASRKHGVDDALVHAVIFVESSYDPEAISPQGALGLMQLMPETARHYGVRDALDPAQNVEGGVRLLKDLLDQFDDDVELALAAYNSGTSAVVRAGYRVPEYDETLAFVPRVLGYYRAYRTVPEPAKVSNQGRSEPVAERDSLRRAIELSPELPRAPVDPDGSEHGKRMLALAATRRQRKRHAGRIFGTGGTAAKRREETLRHGRGRKPIEATSPVTMANSRRGAPRTKAAARKKDPAR